MSLVSATAASGSKGKSSTASEVAAYTARLQLLQVALHQSARAVMSSSKIDVEQSSRGKKQDDQMWYTLQVIIVQDCLHAAQSCFWCPGLEPTSGTSAWLLEFPVV